MLKISKAVSSKQAQRYYRVELKAEREISAEVATISRDAESLERTAGKWHGKLAEQMNLRGAVTTTHFERLCDGRHPLTDEELVRYAPVKHYTNRFGKEITTMEHRALWDATFSAPKSVSLAAIAGGDDRIREAHRESVRSALDEVEKYVEARMGGGKASERTGKMISAVFEHDTARPDKILRYAAPQLHTHAVVFNMTETADGRIKPVQPLELYRTQRYATAVYRMELADKLQRLGYQIEINPKTKAPEIRGFSPEYLKESSVRSQEIKNEADIIKRQIESAGAEVKNDAGIRQIAAWQQRQSKGFDPEEMKTRTLELEVKHDFQAQKVVGQALENSNYRLDAAMERDRATEAIEFAKKIALPANGIDQNLSQNPVSAPNSAFKPFDERHLLTEALENGIGKTSFAAVCREYNVRNAAGEFANLLESRKPNSYSPDIELAKEKAFDGGGKSLDEHSLSESTVADKTKPVTKVEKISMDDLENAVRAKFVAEKEVSSSFELLIGI